VIRVLRTIQFHIAACSNDGGEGVGERNGVGMMG
jgi:hypothetical protein